MTTDTLKITFKQATDHRDTARERLRQAETGTTGEAIEQDVCFVLNFEEFDDIARLMRTSNLEIVEAIVSEEPASIRELATLVDRDYRDVHRNVTTLESLGVLELEPDGSRKRPMLRAGAETIDFSIRFPLSPDRGDTPDAVA